MPDHLMPVSYIVIITGVAVDKVECLLTHCVHDAVIDVLITAVVTESVNVLQLLHPQLLQCT